MEDWLQASDLSDDEGSEVQPARGVLRRCIRLNVRSLSRIVEELVPEYLAARKNEVSQMRELLASSDFERLRVLSHSLKGSGGSFGFAELTRFGETLERYACAADQEAFSAELSRLNHYLENLNWSPSQPSSSTS